MLDDMLDYIAGIRARPVWQPIPDAVRAHFRADHPSTEPSWQRRQILSRRDGDTLRVELGPMVRTDPAGLEALPGAFDGEHASRQVRAVG